MSNLRKIAVVYVLLLVLTIYWFYFTKSYPNFFNTLSSLNASTRLVTIPITTTAAPWTKYFHATMTANQKEGMVSLLRVFKKQMEKYNITYFLYSGSLIGAYRHHGFIPWDDDVDILVNSEQKELLKESLAELNQTHGLTDYKGKETSKWKFYNVNGTSYSHKPFRYPYLDLFFYKNYNKTAVFVELEREIMLKNDIFPLIDKTFEGVSLPTPCNTLGILKGYYDNLGICSSPSWNHSTEYFIPSSRRFTITCDKLKPYFPFVERQIEKLKDQFHVTEILKQGKMYLQTVTYTIPSICSTNISRYSSNVSVMKS